MPPPRLILTSGEPAGIGPDLCIDIAAAPGPASWSSPATSELLRARAHSSAEDLSRSCPTRRSDARSRASRRHAAGSARPSRCDRSPGPLDAPTHAMFCSCWIAPSTAAWPASSMRWSRRRCRRASINDAGIAFSGHTEYLAERTGGAHPVMMLTNGASARRARDDASAARRDVSAAITGELLERVLRILERDLRTRFGDSGAAHPRLRPQSARRRVRSSRPRGDRSHRTGARRAAPNEA